MKVTADKGRCMAAGHCATTAPEVFDQGEDGLVKVIDPDPGTEHHENVETAVELCPSRAIRTIT